MQLKFGGRHLGFSTSSLVAKYSYESQLKLDPENIGIAIEISLIY